ncbi:MAG: ATP-grasp domain-containing protein [Oscillospiraceae bacterium]|nr:ATP-grasp domain-containing protein [Oscillospiraceae bacterium]
MRDVTVLITACGNVYMPGITDSFKKNGERKIWLIGADMNHDDTILEMFDQYYQVPRGDAPDYADAIVDICVKEHVDVVVPIMSAELVTLAKNKDKFEKAGVKLSVSSLESLEIANNKLKLFVFMQANGISCPRFCAVNSVEDVDRAVEQVGVPIVFKTTEGSGSRGMRMIDPSKSRFDILFHEKPNSSYITLQDFKETLMEGQMPSMLAMEYLPGHEYSVDILCEDGKVFYSLCRRGLNVQTSIILDGIVEEKPEISKLCNQVVEKLKLTGNIGFDVKERADGTPVIMECNPRVTAGISEFTASGVNLLYLNIKRCLGEPIPQLTPKYGVIMKRRYQEMYIG